MRICDATGVFIDYWGFRAIHGRVWTLLALKNRPMSQADVAQALGVSRSLVSSAVSELLEYGLVRTRGANRQAAIEANMDVWPVISEILRTREWMLLESARVALEAAVEEGTFAQQSGETLEWDLERMRALLGFTEMVQQLLKLFLALRMPESAEGIGSWVSRAAVTIRGLRDRR